MGIASLDYEITVRVLTYDCTVYRMPVVMAFGSDVAIVVAIQHQLPYVEGVNVGLDAASLADGGGETGVQGAWTHDSVAENPAKVKILCRYCAADTYILAG